MEWFYNVAQLQMVACQATSRDHAFRIISQNLKVLKVPPLNEQGVIYVLFCPPDLAEWCAAEMHMIDTHGRQKVPGGWLYMAGGEVNVGTFVPVQGASNIMVVTELSNITVSHLLPSRDFSA